MKVAIVLVSLLTLMACEQQDTNNSGRETNTSKITCTDNTDMLGNWTLTSESSNNSMTTYNVPPTVSFNADGSGIVRGNDVVRERFEWTLKHGQLKIFVTAAPTDTTFTEPTYSVTFSKDKTNINMTVEHKKQNSSFYLSKELVRTRFL